MHVDVFRFTKRLGCYVYLAKDSTLDVIPRKLSHYLGTAYKFLTLDLEVKNLIAADNKVVMSAICERGYYIQMPPFSSLHTFEGIGDD